LCLARLTLPSSLPNYTSPLLLLRMLLLLLLLLLSLGQRYIPL
jgi:hypothetical protein